jgi:hypothetical protein
MTKSHRLSFKYKVQDDMMGYGPEPPGPIVTPMAHKPLSNGPES